MSLRLIGFVAGTLTVGAVARAEDWPQFRGPNAQGVTAAKELASEWSAEKNIAWKATVPGVAWSQPIVWGDKIFVTTAITENQTKPRPGGGFGGGGFGGGGFGGPGGRGRGGPPGGEYGPGDKSKDKPSDKPRPSDDKEQPKSDKERPGGSKDRSRGPGKEGFGKDGFGPGKPGGRRGGGFGTGGPPPNKVYEWKLLCLDSTTGKVVWEELVHKAKPTIPTHSTNTYASETPVTDGERIYAYFGMTGLFCYDLSGKRLWKKDVGSFPMMAGWGTGSSPVLDDARVFVQCDNEQESFIAAYDKKTGDEVWKVKRSVKSSWSTPYLWRNKARTELVACGGKGAQSYDPATGKVLWELNGIDGQFQASPVGDPERIYLGGGSPFGSRPLFAIRAGATGDVTPSSGESTSAGVAWSRNSGGPSMASPLLHAGCLYILDQRGGTLACYDAETGKQHYRQRVPQARGFTSSPWTAGGKIYCLDESGQTFVLAAGPEYKLLGTNKLDDMFWSSAAVVGNKLLLRGVERLYCIAP